MRLTGQKAYLGLSGTIFLLVAVLHLLRLINDWPILVGTWLLPRWASYIGLPAATACALWARWLYRK